MKPRESYNRKRRLWSFPIAVALLVSGRFTFQIVSSQITEGETLKASLLLSFVRFTEWPAAGPDAPITVGVWNQRSVQLALEKLVANKTVNGRPILIRELRSPADLKVCQMAYLGTLSGKKLQEFLTSINEASLLTVGEDERFLQSGGTIHLFEEDGRFSFEVQMERLSQTRLSISSKLLRLGRTVGTERRERGKP